MNRNRKAKVLGYGIAAGALAATAAAGFTTIDAEAAPLAGASATIEATVQTTQTTTNASTVAGANQSVADILAETNATTTAASTSAATETTESDADQTAMAVANVESYVNVRSEASEESEIVGMLYANNAMTIEEEADGWYKVTSGNVAGYVKADYVNIDEAAVAQASTTTASVQTGTLYVRNETSTESEVLGMVSGGEELTVIEDISDEGWVKVETTSGEGYVSADYVTVETTYTYGETIEEYQTRVAEEEAERKAAEEAAAAEAAQKAAAQQKKSTQQQAAAEQEVTYSAPTSSTGSAVASYACQFIGNPYVYGGSSLTNGTDCSGFVMSVYAAFGVSLPHSSSALRSVGTGVSTSDMQPGDIVCYSGHVAIYVGNGTIVHASDPSGGIKYSNVNYHTILAVRRIY